MEGGPLWHDVVAYPATSAVSCLLVAWYVACHVKQWPPEATGINSCKVIERGQWWRLATGQLSHHGIVHLVFNLASLWAIRSLELDRGATDLVKSCCLLMGLSGLGTVVMYRCLPRQQQEQRHLVGFSAVLFGLTVLFTMHTRLTRFFGIVYLPMYCAPFISLAVTQVLVPRSSLVGHLCGIVAGYLIWMGMFAWVSDSLFLLAFPWCVALILLSMRLRPSETFRMEFIEIPSRQATLDDLMLCRDYSLPERADLYRHV